MITDSTYNHANRRVSAAKQGQSAAEYQYSPLGQRIAKKVGGVVTERYGYGAGGELLQVADGQNNPLRQYIYLNGKLVGMYNAQQSTLYYVHHDHLVTPQKLTNQNQQVVWSADYKPFGEATVTGTQEVYSRFPGQYYDVESGLHYNYFRDYDPTIGRYIQSDPIGLEGGINTYGYVGGNPNKYTDAFGLSFSDQAWMTFDWLFGLGSADRTFGEFSDQVQDLKRTPAVSAARDLFYSKNKDGCDCSNMEPVTNYGSGFGATGYAKAWLDLNSTWHFVGSFTIEIYPNASCTSLTFVLTNNSSFRSFMYGIAPAWERTTFGPMGNMRQTYTWTEPMR